MALVRSALRLTRSSGVLAQCSRSMADMPLTFAAPSQVFYNQQDVRQVDVPSFSGNFGILPNHVPVLAVLQPGVVSVVEADGSTNKYFVSSGSVTVNKDSTVQVLAEEAVPLSDLDAAACRQALTQAQADLASATGDQERVEAQIAVEVSEALVKACE
ncbi:ATP synthase subunit delta, mitochondrial [Amphibalanus amphitrite]|uniref:ATP synthase F(1) complex subunit delta, mitochondrial n=1 Tax=Amphibalanus amphitrite TaxID=1232801 RepID=A0A6A4WCF3_AMPAM|nr:ATP synthase subunit delta, mitochondrial-like [Amphibalanus amphitrite]XP_043241696.1 ATP synthase subunit delta, mitochondrial-like [Amphibalanus amphitrite]XP_043241705.1 ATP synthase subunit delta, mitochondrial-like [Amphibalanus amphitrite]XP_043241714.1 ATP synthase subunit delta, mitochondrial-like [Amphibalanus amphitrite]XP_043243238.1 ATP synthase subunit delta, mitochondrial-like [Amphibalanus amphitrite]XP_043243239.1 ATP synthase subunit delta, mitochondrial-like [Amphibalanus